MKRIVAYLIFMAAVISIKADDWVRDTEPAILEVYYTRTEITDTTRRESNFFTEKTILRIGKGISRYCSAPKYFNDSLYHFNSALYWETERIAFESTKNPAERDMNTLARSGRYKSFIYKNYPEGKVTEQSYFDMEDWRYEEDWEKPEWEITDDTKEILGYQCFKAITDYRGRRWTAWFAPEIPVQDGPWKLCGLPGLILEAIDSTGMYGFVATGIQQVDKPIGVVYLTDSYEKSTRKNFLKNKRSFLDNTLSRLNAQLGGMRIMKVEDKNGNNISNSIFVTRDAVDFIETDY